MILNINLSEQEYKVLASVAAQSGKYPEQFMHEVIYRIINSGSIVQRPTERLYLEEEISHVPTKQLLTQEVREEIAQKVWPANSNHAHSIPL